MLFNSPEFVVFFLLVYCLYLGLSFRLQNYMLLVVSYIFYGWWDARFLFLVALSTTIDFWVGLMIENGRLQLRQWLMPAAFFVLSAVIFLGLDWTGLPALGSGYPDLGRLLNIRMLALSLAGSVAFVVLISAVFSTLSRMKDEGRRRFRCLLVSLITQLGLLAVFKYFNFFVDSLSAALAGVGIESSPLHLNIVLPVGISFYTFQSLSYTIDIYRRQFKPTDRFSDFALFVAYFPQLQAGPIERGRHIIPQLARPRTLTIEQTSRGLYLIVLGFFKKVAIADGVSPVVDHIFGSSGRVTWIDVVAASALFAVQIYCDFSGYTDIARGISKMLGINMIVNFNQPYFATNPQDFWRRWHISLSTWLRDYLYVPLGGNQGGLAFICRNLMITMMLGGLWHGASWNFVLWGFYQGAALCVYRIWSEYRGKPAPVVGSELGLSAGHIVRRLLASAGFLIVVCYGWLLFRAHSFAQIVNFTSLLISDFGDLDYGGRAPRLSALFGMALLLAMEIVQYWKADPCFYQRFPVPIRGFLIAAMIAITLMGMSNEPAQFIYFQF
ncbi:putative Membrane bound O-acyl transferase, MBOAT family protein [Bradyrhizobium sp. STM 3843]|uniref:MBOAT family O-acyltransferase n=1 Tax=Bradyrhizobium sp. STM 3843 TaxID=551947 RepID=UPI0002405345|nr:MBOAT family O-acyltransferase [Bradyrhizobium sp. STM 3843]CCE09385.1 putative Membrane bound O-acyl transferase, MBOAT family protein [Bradyrhizobium sp. STM 3843]